MICQFVTTFALISNIFISSNCNGAVVKSDPRLSSFNLPPGVPHHRFYVGASVKRNGGSEGLDSDYSDYYYHDQEEPECEEDHFWHIRGLRCVPYDCPGGNQFRNQHTGECILTRYGVSGDSNVRPSRFLNRGKTQNKFRLPFGLTLKG